MPDFRTAIAYGFLTMIGKWANVTGQRQYRRDRSAGRNTRLIDYKAAGTAGQKPPAPKPGAAPVAVSQP